MNNTKYSRHDHMQCDYNVCGINLLLEKYDLDVMFGFMKLHRRSAKHFVTIHFALTMIIFDSRQGS